MKNKIQSIKIKLGPVRQASQLLFVVLIGIIGMAFPSLSKAEGAIEPVVNVGVQDNGCMLLVVPQGQFNAGGNLTIDPTKPGAKALYATALAALTSGKHIWVNRATYAGICYGIGDYATEIRIQNN